MVNRREFIGALGVTAGFGAASRPSIMSAMQSASEPRPGGMKALAFDAYGTLFDGNGYFFSSLYTACMYCLIG